VVDTAITCSNFDEPARFCRELLSMGVAVAVQIPGDLAEKLPLALSGFRQRRLRTDKGTEKVT
jgi:hypothetical protein